MYTPIANRRSDLTIRPTIETMERRALLSTTPGFDPIFGAAGVTTVHNPTSGDSVIALPNGDALVAGTTPDPYGANHAFIQRYLPNGKIDTSFGAGAGTIPLGANTFIAGIQRDDSGRILIALGGTDLNDGSVAPDYRVLRFYGDGATDKSYGIGGVVDLKIASSNFVSNFAVDNKARAVLTAVAFNPATVTYQPELIRITAQGKFDPAFGTAGIAQIGFYPGPSLAIQPDGKILIGTTTNSDTVYNRPSVIRYNANGTLDSSFGSRGTAVSSVPMPTINPIVPFFYGVASVTALTTLGNGNIVITGAKSDQNGGVHDQPGDYRLFVAELTSKGLPVKSFGTNGSTITVIDSTNSDNDKQIEPSLIVPQHDGSLIIAGNYFLHYGYGASVSNTQSSADVMVVKYNSNGKNDSTFASSGIFLSSVPGLAPGVSTTTPSWAGGKITLAWDYDDSSAFDLLRYNLLTTASVSGNVFNDLNGDGTKSKTETGLTGVMVYADTTHVGYYVFGDPIAITDSNGNYTLVGLDSGTVYIRIKSPTGYHQTTPSSDGGINVSLFSGIAITSLSFGDSNR